MMPLNGYAKAKKYVDMHTKVTDSELLSLRKKYPCPCITISRQRGIKTDSLCNKLINALHYHYPSDWAFFNKDLLRRVIDDHQLPERIKKFLREERQSRLNQMLNELLKIHPPILELIHKMSKTILNLAEIGNVIIIGRGSNIITSHLKNAVHIRLIAPLNYRAEQFQKGKNISKELAKKILTSVDKNRIDFLYRTFKKNIDDPLNYQAVFNVSFFSWYELTDIIVKIVLTQIPIQSKSIKAEELATTLAI